MESNLMISRLAEAAQAAGRLEGINAALKEMAASKTLDEVVERLHMLYGDAQREARDAVAQARELV